MTAEALLEKAERAFASAQLLYAHGDYEGACNRAYYAMFDAAKSALMSITPEIGISASRTHNGLITAFGLHLVKSGKIEHCQSHACSRISCPCYCQYYRLNG